MSRPVVVLGALVLAAFGLASAEDKKDDKTTLQGTWAYESMEWDGKKIAVDQINQTTITFDGDKFTVKVGDKVTMTGTYKFDPAKSPKTVDATLTEGQGKGNTPLGIYKIDGDTITACIKLTGRERPKEFKTTAQSDTVLVVARRVKK
jgi:uncharacterized protein (TIGR03067 family)